MDRVRGGGRLRRRLSGLEQLEQRALLSVVAAAGQRELEVPAGADDRMGVAEVAAAAADGVWIDFRPQAPTAEPLSSSLTAEALSAPDFFTVDYVGQGLGGRISVPGVLVKTVAARGTSFSRLAVPGWGHTDQPGGPELPVLRTSLRVPTDARLVAEHTIRSTASLGSGHVVYPVQPPQPAVAEPPGAGPQQQLVYDASRYGIAAAQTEVLTVSEAGIARGQRVVLLCFAPFEYQPATGEIRVVTELRWSLEFVNAGEDGPSQRPQAADPAGERPQPTETPAAEAIEADYLIITADEYYDEVLPLARWKQRKGWKSYVARTSEVGATDEDIADYISGVYHAGNPTSYVLIVGDQEDVPGYEMVGHIYHGAAHVWHTDYPYACVDGDDLLADLAIGRLPADSESLVTSMVDRVLRYERSPDMGDWYDDVLMAAYFQDGGEGTSERMFMETVHRVADFLGGDFGFWGGADPYDQGYTVHTALTPENTYSTYHYGGWWYPGRVAPPDPVPAVWTNLWTSASVASGAIADAVNQGVSLVLHRDHGSSAGWVHPGFSITDVEELANGERLPLVLSLNCETGRFDTTDCFAESWLRRDPGGGIGVVAPVRVSYTGFNDALTLALFDGFWDDADPAWTSTLYPQSWRPAEALNRAKGRILEAYGVSNAHAVLTARMFNWFGDPEMMVRTGTPWLLSVSYPAVIPMGSDGDVSVEVSHAGGPLEGARVCISKAGTDDYWVGLTDAAGRVTFADFVTAAVGDYDVVVTAHDAVPYQGSISSVAAGPFAKLVAPAADSITNADLGYVDIQWLDFSGTGLDASTIDAEDIHVAGVTIHTPTPQGDGVWRYQYDGGLVAGRVEVVVRADQVRDNRGDGNAGRTLRFVYDIQPPAGRLDVPAAGAAVYVDPGHVDVFWSDAGLAGLDVSTLDQNDVLVDGVTVAGSPTRQESGAWRYCYDGRLPIGAVSVQFVSGEVRDLAGNANAGHTQSFHFAPLEITSPADLPTATQDEPYEASLQARGGVAPYRWSLPLPVVITECDLGNPDYIEIQNTSGQLVDTSGWVVAVSNSYATIDRVSPTCWHLPDSIPAGAVLHKADLEGDDHYWGDNILWNEGEAGWAAIVDDAGKLVDFVAWQWSAEDLAAMSAEINGHRITIGEEYVGDGLPSTGEGSIQRIGNEDHNLPDDFAWVTPPSHGAQNAALTLPFVGAGMLPPGLRCDGAAGVIRGTPTDAGSFDFRVSVQDSASPPHLATREFRLDVLALPPLRLDLPGNAAEDDGSVDGAVSIPGPLTADLTVELHSDDLSEVTVPAEVVIPAGETHAPFHVTIVDDAELDWIQEVTVTASATAFSPGTSRIAVHDNETASLTVWLPARAAEGEGVLYDRGIVAASVAPSSDVVVALYADDTSEVGVPETVTIPAGETLAVFDLAVLDDDEIDGTQTVTITARVENWTDGRATIEIDDDEDRDLLLKLPTSDAWESYGLLQGGGVVILSGTLPADLTVSLASDDQGALIVPPSVVIPAGRTFATFDLTVVDDADRDGSQTVSVVAAAGGFQDGTDAIRVLDDEVDHFAFHAIDGPRTAGEPFQVTVEARNVDQETIRVYEGQVGLSGLVETGPGSTVVISDADAGSPDKAESSNVSGEEVDRIAGAPLDRWLISEPLSVVPDCWIGSPLPSMPEESLVYQRVGTADHDHARDWGTADGSVGSVDPLLAVVFPVGAGSVPVRPAVSGAFVSGVWAGQVTVDAVENDVVLRADDGAGHTGQSNPFDVVAGPLDHFQWAAIDSPQYVQAPIDVILTARDAHGFLATGFDGSVELSGWRKAPLTTLFKEDFEDGDFEGWSVGSGAFTRRVSTETAAGGQNSFTMIGGDQQHARGVWHEFDDLVPERIEFSVRSGDVGRSNAYFLVQGESGTAVLFHVGPDGTIGVSDADSRWSAPCAADRWYDVSFRFDWANRQFDYYLDGVLVGSGIPLHDAGVDHVSRIDLYNYSYSQAWWDEIELLGYAEPLPLPVLPPGSGPFLDGVWSGQVEVLQPAAEVVLRADDGAGHASDSNAFQVAPLPPLTVDLPAHATEGDGVVQGAVRIPGALDADLTVDLSSDDPTEANVPGTVTIVAGATEATFPVTIVDDSDLDWIRQAAVTASAAGYMSGIGTVLVHDNETAALTLALPPQAREGDGVLSQPGTVTASARPTSDVTVQLACDDATEVSVPAAVTIPAGEASATFDVTVVDDTQIDGLQTVTVTARVENWTDGSDDIEVLDNEPRTLELLLPPELWEGEAPIPDGGILSLSGTLPTDLVVSLLSDDGSELRVPEEVTIPAGEAMVAFELTVVDDEQCDGVQLVSVRATAPGFDEGFSPPIHVRDDDVHHFVWDSIGTPRTAGEPFSVRIEARDVHDEPILVYGDTANLSGWIEDGTSSTIVISEVATSSPDTVEFTNVCGADVDISGWQVVIYDRNSGTQPLTTFTIPSDTVCPADHVFLLFQRGTSPGTYPEFYTGENISWRPDEPLGVLLLDAAGGVVDFLAASTLDPSQITDPVTPVPDSWHGQPISSQPDDTLNYVRTGDADHDSAGDFRHLSPSIGLPNPGLVVPFRGVAAQVPVTPTVTAAFDGGAWAGQVSVGAVEDEVVLRADDGSGHAGLSNAFDVTAGPADHFRWGVIDSPQRVGEPFGVTLTAVDAHGFVATGFAGPAQLSGWEGTAAETLFAEDFEDGNDDGWLGGGGPGLRAVTNQAAAGGEFSFTIDGASGPYLGVSHPLADLTPDRVDFHVRSSDAGSSDGFSVLGSAAAGPQAAVLFRMDNSGTMGVLDHGYLWHGVPYVADQWYKVSLLVDWPGKEVDYHVDDVLVEADISFFDLGVDSFSTVWLHNVGDSRAWWDEIRLFRQTEPSPVPIVPAEAEPFVDGVWSGEITVHGAAGGLILRAEGGQGRASDSNPFDVEALPGELRGRKFHDVDGDGDWDPDEDPLEGWKIYLDLNENGGWDPDEPYETTDAAGRYAFTDLTPHRYGIGEVPAAGWEQTFPDPDPGHIRRVSLAPDGSEADEASFAPALSADGRYVAFHSYATNLVAQDTNATSDVFVCDRRTGSIVRVSVGSDGSEADGFSNDASLSGDGRYVAFSSYATNLVAGDTNDQPDVFVYDRQTGILERVSIASDGSQSEQASSDPVLSADGRYVAFRSQASNLVPDDTNGQPDVFVYDRQTGVLERVSVATDGSQGDRPSGDPALSADGRYVAFASGATNLVSGDTNGAFDVFIRDLQSGTTHRVSLAWDGSQANSNCIEPSLSADGRRVAYASPASNLVPSAAEGAQDVFVYDRRTGEVRCASDAWDGSPSDGTSYGAVLSADGRLVAYASSSSNLVPGDENNSFDVFVHDLSAKTTWRLSVAADGLEGNSDSNHPTLSTDGSYVAFYSSATNLVPGDTSWKYDVFLARNPAADRPGMHTVSLGSDEVLEGLNFGNRPLAGPLDHFEFAEIDSPNYAQVPFCARLAAVDAEGRLVGDFQGSLELSGWAGLGEPAATVALSPTRLDGFEGGLWTGEITVLEAADDIVLRADDGQEHVGLSNRFDVEAVPGLWVQVPAETAEGDGVVQGTVSIPHALRIDLVVGLQSDDETEAAVSPELTIPAGELQATFQLTVVDDSELDGVQQAVISAAAVGSPGGAGTIAVADNETAVLTLHLPAAAVEGAGVLAGQGLVCSDAAPASNVLVALSSDDTTEVSVPAGVTIPAGQTSAAFDLTILDDQQIDGTQTATVTARVKNWIQGLATIDVVDDEGPDLAVYLPASAREGDGPMADAAEVRISGTLPADLVVALACDDTTELRVPADVTIPAGETRATFDLDPVDDPDCDGVQAVTVSATAAGFTRGTARMDVADDDVHHFAFDAIDGPQVVMEPLAVTIRARDVNHEPIPVFSGAVNLSGRGAAGPLPVDPSVAGPFVGGTWSGEVTIQAVDTDVVLTADHGSGHLGSSNPFHVVAGAVDHFQWATILSGQSVNTPFSATLTALDAHGFTVTDFDGALELSAWDGSGTTSTVVITECGLGTPDFIEIQNVSGQALDTSGWTVAVSGSYTDINVANSITWTLPSSIAPGETLSKTDEDGELGWGSNVRWDSGKAGWAMILDDAGQVVDFVAWHWTAAEIAELDLEVNGHRVTLGDQFVGDGVASAGTGSLQRRGHEDRNVAADFVWGWPPSKDVGNADLTVPFVDGANPVPVTPTVLEGFADGVWTGPVMAHRDAAGMVLRADPGTGQVFDSDPFDVDPLPYEITGYKFQDLDADGRWDAEEGGLEGWTIYVDMNLNRRWDPMEPLDVTRPDGSYRIQVVPGTYKVAEVVRPGWRQTFPGGAGTHNVPVAADSPGYDVNFGNRPLPAEIHGRKWNDLDRDGRFDPGEPGLANWAIYLDENLNGNYDEGEPQTTTDADGWYHFAGLQAGTYVVGEVPQEGWKQTYPGPEYPDAAAASSTPSEPTPAPAVEITTAGQTAPIFLTGEVVASSAAGELVLETSVSGGLIHMDRFRSDPRFADVDGGGFAAVVLDTGIAADHPFFGPDRDADGIADRIVYQWDFADDDPEARDSHGHGSNVSSIIASEDPTYTGMAPGADIIALKVFEDEGSGEFSTLEEALQWVLEHAAEYNVASVNMSLGDGENYGTPQTLYGLGDELAGLAAIDVVVVSAAGNDFFPFDSVQGVAYPAADPNSLAAGAVYDSGFSSYTYGSGAVAHSSGPDRIAPFSQRDATPTTVFAPGAPITGAGPSGTRITMHGTSQAAPHLAGIAVLAQDLATQHLGRRLTPGEFRDLLVDTAATIHDGDDEDDNVVNTGLDFPRVDVLALAEGILALGGAGSFHTVVLEPGQVAADVDFGNRVVTEVVGRHVFYNNSAFDGNDPTANADDDPAIAPDPDNAPDPRLGKTALLPGQTATFQNYTSYHRGINGVMIDIAGPLSTPAADSFQFRVGNDNHPQDWPDGPLPRSVTVREGGGADGSDRVTIIWDDFAITGEWLQVTVLAEGTGLARDDVSYFGNAPGEAGDATGDAIVNSVDEILARSHPHGPRNPAAADVPYDYNRDRLVDSIDRIIARSHRTGAADALRLIAVPANGTTGAEGDGAAPRHDAVLRRAELRARDHRQMPSGKLAWLLDFDQWGRHRRAASHTGGYGYKEAIDLLLVGPGP